MAMTLRLNDEQDRVLQEVADAQGISKHEAVLRAIEDYARRRVELRAAVLNRIVNEDAELLDLLSR
jgi:predicted transcriptional regulator